MLLFAKVANICIHVKVSTISLLNTFNKIIKIIICNIISSISLPVKILEQSIFFFSS